MKSLKPRYTQLTKKHIKNPTNITNYSSFSPAVSLSCTFSADSFSGSAASEIKIHFW